MNATIMCGAAMCLMLAACGGEMKEAAEGLNNLKNIAESAGDVQKNVDAAQKKQQERRAKGDTLALSYEELGKLLVDVSGTTAEEPTGESVGSVMGSWSMARRTYTKGSQSFEVVITDYNASSVAFAGATAIFAINMSSDNPEKKSATFRTDDPTVNGFAEYYKKENRATILWGIGSRFILNLTAKGVSSAEEAKDFAKNFNLKKLSAM